MEPNNGIAKCKGTDCAYKSGCSRYVRPAGDHQQWQDFWKGGDDCPHYIPIQKPIK